MMFIEFDFTCFHNSKFYDSCSCLVELYGQLNHLCFHRVSLLECGFFVLQKVWTCLESSLMFCLWRKFFRPSNYSQAFSNKSNQASYSFLGWILDWGNCLFLEPFSWHHCSLRTKSKPKIFQPYFCNIRHFLLKKIQEPFRGFLHWLLFLK